MLYVNKNSKWDKLKELYLNKKYIKMQIRNITSEIKGRDIVLNSLNTESSIYPIVFKSFSNDRELKRLHLEQLIKELKNQPNLVKVFFSILKQK